MVAAQIIIILHGIIPKRLTNTQKHAKGFIKLARYRHPAVKILNSFSLENNNDKVQGLLKLLCRGRRI
jgi:hypothetical protein